MEYRSKVRILSLFLMAFLAACGGSSANIQVGPMPQGKTFHGTYSSPQYGNMHLCVADIHVFGDYVKNERTGTITGTITGDTLRFRWEETREIVSGRPTTSSGRGYFQMRLDENGDGVLVGEWGLGEDETGQIWEAIQLRNREPTRCMNRGEEGAEPTTTGTGGNGFDREGNGFE